MAKVYRHRRLNGDVFYVGMTTTELRPWDVMRRNDSWKEILLQDGNFTVEIVADNISKQDAYDLEMLLIQEYGRLDLGTGLLTNHCDGGPSGSINLSFKTNEKRKKKMSKKMKGKNNPMYGTQSQNRKLTEQDIINIRKEYVPYKMTMQKLADKYSVTRSTIYSIIAKKHYKEFDFSEIV
jgi:hypothetical protein